MVRVRVELVKAFSADRDGGNPAGVVFDADDLNDQQMLAVARELGFSESAFLSRSDKADVRVRFFAAKAEVDFCGHATVATAYSYSRRNPAAVTMKFETNLGLVEVRKKADGSFVMRQKPAVFGETLSDRGFVAGLLGLDQTDLKFDLPIQVVTTETPKLIVPVGGLAELRKIKPDLNAIGGYTRDGGARGLYVFCRESFSDKADFSARAFNPHVGIDEDPATGVAAGPLGAYADKYLISDGAGRPWLIEQGFDMGMPSTLTAEVVNSGVLVGGFAVGFGESKIEA